MVVRVTEPYLDSNYDSKEEKGEIEVPVHANVEAARTACGDLELEILNLGLQAMARKQLVEICRAKFPATWYSPKAYQACFESNRPKLEEKGFSGIKDLRNAFLDKAKKNAKIREQIAFMTKMESIDLDEE